MMFKQRQRSSSGTKPIKIEDISRELIPITGRNSFAIVLHNVLSPEECQSLIYKCESEGFDDALVQGPTGKQILRQDIRSCGRCIIDDAGLADAIYARILNAVRGTKHEKKIMHAPWITALSSRSGHDGSSDELTVDGGGEEITAVGLNERLRFLKYGPGHFFAPHQDLRFVRGPECGERAGETSHVTVQVYLNDKFKGGATRFLADNGRRHYDVRPRMGSLLLFDHDLLHEGERVSRGIKYSVRSDVMFSRTPAAAQWRGSAPEIPTGGTPSRFYPLFQRINTR